MAGTGSSHSPERRRAARPTRGTTDTRHLATRWPLCSVHPSPTGQMQSAFHHGTVHQASVDLAAALPADPAIPNLWSSRAAVTAGGTALMAVGTLVTLGSFATHAVASGLIGQLAGEARGTHPCSTCCYIIWAAASPDRSAAGSGSISAGLGGDPARRILSRRGRLGGQRAGRRT